ncbi:hypothetical protein KUCAC02_016333 [Chaenocephalus aceratus]|uniref:Uncharacterized protein n=1 Tax=Chaenocephalus aceratus TaxID=36190 RepID=A0ACB9Y1U1_CHAAC|nr:hypothetical protein KUCAC02_016333 [Chaenocephalus aceratus]
MALSQVQCLDNHHVNWRVSEGKPEFFYSEDQRLAIEVLVTKAGMRSGTSSERPASGSSSRTGAAAD